MISNNDLMKALYSGDLEAIKTSLENGADVNKPYNTNGYTPFMFACREFYEPEVIELFLSHGGDVNSRNISGETPFMISAKKRSNPATLNFLLSAGSNINAQDNHGNTYEPLESLEGIGVEANDNENIQSGYMQF
ncbi:MAG: ankyrin repeat domain-containing protein [Alphaproteobacteria bacterium]|nr:ankyrin repeat domain-containing protein [Alphaproteobacteria bacterium]